MTSRQKIDPDVAVTRFCETLRFEQLPPDVVTALKAMIADAIACAMAGSAAPLNAAVFACHARWGGALKVRY